MTDPAQAPSSGGPTDGAPGAGRRRGDRSADSRALILEAAVNCLAEKGYADTTTLAIQARAGVSRGRLLHHFPSRDALLVAAAQHLAAERLLDGERWAAGLGPESGGDRERVIAAVKRCWSTFEQPYFWAAVELWVACRTRPELRETLRPEEHRLGAAIRQTVAVMYGPKLSAHPNFPAVRDLLFTSMRGVMLTYTFDARDPAADRHLPIWIDAALTLLEVED
ncbi:MULTISPECIES: TetR/AcrR family transcriptional regulator [Sporichthya]|uniref:HTH tetR-type domain-containing protein n=1 Tax=Sporichthya brevicatena TaxID=171442 RepID=A0ABN1H5V4_9ACTN|nr:TetR/AcrR family transcriptional regulator [Sporichthya polymorpha]